MRKVVMFAIALIAVSAAAAERGYQFTLTPDPHGLKLTDGEGTHWKWVSIGCPTSKPDCEWVVNDRSAGGRGLPDMDLGFVLKDPRTAQMRCLRPACGVRWSLDDGEPARKRMTSEETTLIPMNARVAVSFDE